MTITEMKKDLASMKRSLKSLVRAAGDDMGCDGTAEEAHGLRESIYAMERDIRDVQVVRNYACPLCHAMPGEECRSTVTHPNRYTRTS